MNTQNPAPRSASNGWITVTLAVIGGFALVGAGGTAAIAATADLARTDSLQRIDVTGVTEIDMNTDASDVRVEFGDVDEAELSVNGGRGGAWTLERDEDELIVRSPDSWWGWWFGRWFDDDRDVVLTLPESLEGVDASFVVNAGGLDVDGRFGDLDVELAAGDVTISGQATALDAEVSAGGADILLDGVDEADLRVSAGELTVELTGAAPRETSIEVSAGSADVILPDEQYNVTQNLSAGDLDNRLGQSSSSSRTVEVTVSAGSVTLRPGD